MHILNPEVFRVGTEANYRPTDELLLAIKKIIKRNPPCLFYFTAVTLDTSIFSAKSLPLAYSQDAAADIAV
jgi:hypothetical protein